MRRLIDYSPRLPNPVPNMELNFGSYSNGNGFAWAAVKDFQRVFACLDISAGQMPDDEYGAKIAGFEFSPRVTVPMSAQAEWRTGMLGYVQGGMLCHVMSFCCFLHVGGFDMFRLQWCNSRTSRTLTVGIDFPDTFVFWKNMIIW